MTELIGRRFGRLVVVAEVDRGKNRKRRWLCACDCGGSTVTDTNKLTSGYTKSCGCLTREVARLRHTVHGGKGTRLYTIWKNARQRCRNPRSPDFPLYGGRGIRFTTEWDSFAEFRDWAMNAGYTEELTLDRIDPDGDYAPNNCRWATWGEQRHNQRRCKGVMP